MYSRMMRVIEDPLQEYLCCHLSLGLVIIKKLNCGKYEIQKKFSIFLFCRVLVSCMWSGWYLHRSVRVKWAGIVLQGRQTTQSTEHRRLCPVQSHGDCKKNLAQKNHFLRWITVVHSATDAYSYCIKWTIYSLRWFVQNILKLWYKL